MKRMRTIKLFAGLTDEYEIIETDAPNEVIVRQMQINNRMEETGESIDDSYGYIKEQGYTVELIASQDDDFDEFFNEDESFDYYDV